MQLKFFRRIVCAAVLALSLGQAAIAADTITEGFDSANGSVMPKGWSAAGSSSTYKADKEIYHSAKPSIAIEGVNTSAYLITPILQGEFNFWIRNYTKNYQASVTAYACIYDGDKLTIGDQIDTRTLPKTSSGTPSWTNIAFNSPTATRVALLISQAYFDDFTYTPAEATSGASLLVKDFANGSEYDFGTVAAGTEHTFNLINQGTEELIINKLSVSEGFEIVKGEDLKNIEAGKTAEVTVATKAESAEGSLTIETNDAENSSYVINLKSTYKVPAPVMEVSTLTLNFGKVTSEASEDIIIKNSGDAVLTVAATCNNPAFILSENSFNIDPDGEATLTVTFKNDAGTVGANKAVITLTPNAGENVTVESEARVPDPDVWTETFESNELPEGWELEGTYWTFADEVAKGTFNSSKAYLTTPSLKVDSPDDVLTFQYRTTFNGKVTIKIQMSKDGGDFKDYATITESTKVQDFKDYEIKGLEPGSYRFRFENEDYDLDNFEGFKLDMNAPKMVVLPVETAAFGKVTAKPEGKVYTVSNTGTGTMTVNISSSNDDFSVTPATLENIEPGEPATFTVNFEYDITNLGEKEATITITPTYNQEAAVSFKATATAKDPNIWEEDFEEGVIPQGWSTTGWTVEKASSYYGNGTYMAYAGTSSNDYTLTTPRLYATEGQELKFEVGKTTDQYDPLTVECSHDLETWTEIEDSPITTSGEKIFKAPSTGFYYLRFRGKYGRVDNFIGFKLAMKDHDLSIAGQNIPATGHQYVEYVATVTVKEMMGNPETATATLYLNGENVAETSQEIGANETETLTLSFVPKDGIENAEAYIIVTYADAESIKGEQVNVTIAEAPVWDENGEADIKEGTIPVVVFNYTPVHGWNTISVPFALKDEYLTQIFGESYCVYELKEYKDGIIRFQEAITKDGKYAAGYPYVVYVSDVLAENPDIETWEAIEDGLSDQIILENVKIEQSTPRSEESNGVIFTSEYSRRDVEDGETIYALNPETSKLEKTKTLKGYRSYITLNPSITTMPEVKFYDGNGQETGVEFIPMEIIPIEGIYNLQGVRVTEPLSPGIYIVNGKKKVIR